MKLSSVLIISLLFVLNNFSNIVDGQANPGDIIKVNTETIQKWTNVGVAVSNAVGSQDLDSTVKMISSLSQAIPYLGPITSIFQGLIDIFGSKPDQFAEINKKLTEMNGRLFAIANGIKDLSKQVKKVAILENYQAEAQKIDIIQGSYEMYTKIPTKINMGILIEDCKQHKIIVYINYVNKQLTQVGEILPLMEVMKAENDMKNFQTWIKMLVSSTSQAMMLHSVCMAVQYRNDSDFQKTMDGYIEHFKKITDNMAKVSSDGVEEIKRNCLAQMKLDVRRYAEDNQLLAHDTFRDKVQKMLSDKFFWRYWFVASYNGKTSGDDQHYVMPFDHFVYSWSGQLERSVYVGSTNNANFQVDMKLNYCLKRFTKEINDKLRYSQKRAKLVYDVIKPCFVRLNGFGVVKHGNDFKSRYPFAAAAAIDQQWWYGGFYVFAIAPEK